MAAWARIDGGIVAEIVTTDPAGRYNPALVWVSCGATVQVGWTYSGTTFAAPATPAGPTLAQQAKPVLADADTTMHRIQEAVTLGLTTWTAADVVAWVTYRRALRAIVSGTDTTSTTLPTKPAYPAGT